MPAYLVRLIDTRDLLGVLFAEEPEHLIPIIDEVTDADACEYTELPDGGIMWGTPAIGVPIEIDKDASDLEEIPVVPWRGAEWSEDWWSVLYGYTDAEWTKFFPDKPVSAGPPAPRRPLGPGRVMQFRKRR